LERVTLRLLKRYYTAKGALLLGTMKKYSSPKVQENVESFAEHAVESLATCEVSQQEGSSLVFAWFLLVADLRHPMINGLKRFGKNMGASCYLPQRTLKKHKLVYILEHYSQEKLRTYFSRDAIRHLTALFFNVLEETHGAVQALNEVEGLLVT